MRLLLMVSMCGIALLATGCGEPAGTVSGTLTIEGKPLNCGYIIFQASEGSVESTEIQPDGTYSIEGLPLGSAKISINVPAPPLPGPDGVSADTPEAFEADPVSIPERYGAVETSGLTYEVTKGAQTHDINLEEGAGE
jgi:hypothetical protein